MTECASCTDSDCKLYSLSGDILCRECFHNIRKRYPTFKELVK